MRLGKMNKRITVFRQGAETRNDMNEPVRPWEQFGKFWSERLSQKPTESWKAGQTAAQVERIFRVRYTNRAATITASDRLICDQQEFEIIGVTELGRRDRIEIVAIANAEEGLSNESQSTEAA